MSISDLDRRDGNVLLGESTLMVCYRCAKYCWECRCVSVGRSTLFGLRRQERWSRMRTLSAQETRTDVSLRPSHCPTWFGALATIQPGRTPRSPPFPQTRRQSALCERRPFLLDRPRPEREHKNLYCLTSTWQNDTFFFLMSVSMSLVRPVGPGGVFGWEGLT